MLWQKYFSEREDSGAVILLKKYWKLSENGRKLILRLGQKQGKKKGEKWEKSGEKSGKKVEKKWETREGTKPKRPARNRKENTCTGLKKGEGSQIEAPKPKQRKPLKTLPYPSEECIKSLRTEKTVYDGIYFSIYENERGKHPYKTGNQTRKRKREALVKPKRKKPKESFFFQFFFFFFFFF